MLDFFQALKAPLVLVSRHYLGSINHTLLSAEALRRWRVPVLGIVFNGKPNPESESLILRHTAFRFLLRIEPESRWTARTTLKYAGQLRRSLCQYDLV
jgi:dethiobiotin synthetase